MNVTIAGAGIIGLSTASELLREYRDLRITIVSDKTGAETTSNGAAGIFRPGGGFRVQGDNVDGRISKSWIKDSFQHYDAILHSGLNPAAHGVKETSGYLFADGDRDTTRNDLLEDLVPVYRSVEPDELKICPGDWKFGSYFTTLVIDSSLHIKWLADQIQDRVTFRRQELKSLQDLQSRLIFNCTGLGAKWLCKDNSIVPIRGQVYKVHAPWIKMFYYSNSDTYIIPGMNQVTLGGTRQFDNYSTAICPHDSAGIWERCTRLVPNLQKATVVREWAGLRPYRDGGVRCEVETVGRDSVIVHNYGHGGYGITFAPGASKHSLKLFHEQHRRTGNRQLSKL